jgi:hypothetical protein
MYLYIPIDGRSVVVECYTISGTGMQFDDKEPCLEKLVGTVLTREDTSVAETTVVEPPVAETPVMETSTKA